MQRPSSATKQRSNASGVGTPSKASTLPSLVTIEGYIAQLRGKQGNDGSAPDEAQRVAAAQALGCLAGFLPPKLRPDTLPIATELGAWQALVAVLASGMEATELEDAAVVSLAQLLVPPAAEEAPQGKAGTKASTYTGSAPPRPFGPPAAPTAAYTAAVRLVTEGLMEDEFLLGQLAAVLNCSANSSRVLMAVARIVTIAATRHALHPANNHLLISSPLPKALIEHTARPAADHHIRDSAACALASLSLASATPDMFKAQLGCGLFEALATLYKHR